MLPALANQGWLADLSLRRLANPRWGGGRLDAEMLLYLGGARTLRLTLLSSVAST